MQCSYASWIATPPSSQFLKLSNPKFNLAIAQQRTQFQRKSSYRCYGFDNTDNLVGFDFRLPSHVESITSTSNPFVKHCLKLRHNSSYRHSHGSVLVVGATPISEICRYWETLEGRAVGVDYLLLLDKAEIPKGLDGMSIHIVRVSSAVMKKLSGVHSTEAIEAIALMRISTSFSNVDVSQNGADCKMWFPFPHRVLVLDGIQDPGNLGTLIRSAVAFRWVTGVAVTTTVAASNPGKTVTETVEEVDDNDGDGEISDLYHNPEVFRLNYKEMERKFKVYIYPDGDPNTFYQTPRKLTGKYASEGYFFQNIRESKFRTEDPDQAHIFFIPISCHKMRGKGTSYENMTIIVQNYVDSLIAKYPYWNRTLGADHFFVTCHDVGVRATEGVPFLVKNAIRVVCSPSYDVNFIPHKDVALPQVLQPFALPAGGNDIENRTTLGFWAGHRNSKIRVILARVWENDTELDISNNRISRATGPLVYQKRFYRTKFCICPGGSQVNSARIADSIHYGCVPVILSDYYDLPFNDILDWHKFSVIVKEHDVYQLKQILKAKSTVDFPALHKNLVKVQKHFQWNSPPIKYDAFHMVMYDLWLRHHVIKY